MRPLRVRAKNHELGSWRAALPFAVCCVAAALVLTSPSASAKRKTDKVKRDVSPSASSRVAGGGAQSGDAGTSAVGIPCTGANEALDGRYGLCWEYTMDATLRTLADAQTYCAGLGTEWRVPTIDELRTTIDTADHGGCAYTALGGPCLVSDPGCLDDLCELTCVDACDSNGFLVPFLDQIQNGENNRVTVLSSSLHATTGAPFTVGFRYAWLSPGGIDHDYHVRCVADAETCSDTDADGVCDDVDLCEGDDATGDDDGDGTCNGLDLCPSDRLKTTPGWCGCGAAEGTCDNGVLCDGANQVADPATVLCWQQEIVHDNYRWHDPIDYHTLQDAETHCRLLGPGWRVPTIDELRTIIDPACPQQTYGGGCGLTDPSCLDSSCDDNCADCGFGGGHLYLWTEMDRSDHYLTTISSSINPDTNEHWAVNFDAAHIHGRGVASKDLVRCVANLGSGTVLSHCAGIGDADGDGACDPDDLCTGNDKYGDADLDGVCEGLDLCRGDDATGDSDGDGICDDIDLCTGHDGTGDVDGNGICEDSDPCSGDPAQDSDYDRICDADDLCMFDNLNDKDVDGRCDRDDNCAMDHYDDRDFDGVCDVSDPCPLDINDDEDGDGLCRNVDLCLGDNSTGDSDGDGVCDDRDICVGNDLYGDFNPVDGICDEFQCHADMPPFYDQKGSDIDWTAGGTCVEAEGLAGPPACPEADWQLHVDDINWALANYPWTNAVYDSQTGAGQAFQTIPYTLVCSGMPLGFEHRGIFDDLNGCYHATNDWKFDGNFSFVRFDWGVNVWEAIGYYDERIFNVYGGVCELDTLVGTPKGFHATNDTPPWRYWTVIATEDCDYYGCRCDATLTYWTNLDTWEHFEDAVVNRSGPRGLPGQETDCTDPRFNF